MFEEVDDILRICLESLAESHIESYRDRYWRKDLESIGYDLRVNHDNNIEIEDIEMRLGRKLTSNERDYVSEKFIEEVLRIFFR